MASTTSRRTPVAVMRALDGLGHDVTTWRKLRHLTVEQVADRAGISRSTVLRLESGQGASLENVLRVARALGALDLLTKALDPYATDVGRLRADEELPKKGARTPSGYVSAAEVRVTGGVGVRVGTRVIRRTRLGVYGQESVGRAVELGTSDRARSPGAPRPAFASPSGRLTRVPAANQSRSASRRPQESVLLRPGSDL